MKKNHFLVVIFILFGCFTNAFSQVSFSFEDFDYPTETIINGQQGKTSFFIPIADNTFLSDSKIKIDFLVPEILQHERSFITVALNGVPMTTKSPDKNNHRVEVELSLNRSYVSSGFLRVDVYTNLKVSDELCEVYNEGVFWVRILSSSSITFKNQNINSSVFLPKDISECVSIINKIIIPSNPSLETFSFATYLKFYFERKLGKKVVIDSFENSDFQAVDASIILAEYENLPEYFKNLVPIQNFEDSDGIITLHSAENNNDGIDKSYQRNLIVTGETKKAFTKAASFALSKDMMGASLTNSVAVKQGRDLSISNTIVEFKKINFKELGVSNELIEGIGKMAREVNIPRSYFGSNVKKLELNLDIAFRPVDISENAYLNIYFDDVLKESFQLDNKGKFTSTMIIDDIEIKKENVLKVEFYFVPEGGMCIANASSFYAQLNTVKSSLRPVSYANTPTLNYFYFPENFQENQTIIYVDLANKFESVEPLADLISILNPGNLNDNDFNFPVIEHIDKLSLNDSNESRIILVEDILVLEEQLTKDAYVKFNSNLVDFKSDVFTNFFNVSYADDLAFSQLFYYQSSPTLLFLNPTKNKKSLAQLINGMKGHYLTNTGNIIVANDSKYYFFNTTDTSATQDIDAQKSNFEIYWNKYRLFFVFALFLLMLVLLIYIFTKSKESKKNIIDNEK